jgi:hypothetical protein
MKVHYLKWRETTACGLSIGNGKALYTTTHKRSVDCKNCLVWMRKRPSL